MQRPIPKYLWHRRIIPWYWKIVMLYMINMIWTLGPIKHNLKPRPLHHTYWFPWLANTRHCELLSHTISGDTAVIGSSITGCQAKQVSWPANHILWLGPRSDFRLENSFINDKCKRLIFIPEPCTYKICIYIWIYVVCVYEYIYIYIYIYITYRNKILSDMCIYKYSNIIALFI